MFELHLETHHRGAAARFQSAMRIFCCSNFVGFSRQRDQRRRVSIRHADFLLFELDAPRRLGLLHHGFNPPCGFFVVRTAGRVVAPMPDNLFQSAMRIFCCSNGTPWNAPTALRSFNPPCGFFVVRTRSRHRVGWSAPRFNPPCGFFVVRTVGAIPAGAFGECFNPPCGFFVVRTVERLGTATPAAEFQSAMRIFCCSNHSARASPRLATQGFNPPCGFFVVRTPGYYNR